MIQTGMNFGWKLNPDATGLDGPEVQKLAEEGKLFDKNFVQYVPVSGIKEEGWIMPTEDAKQLCRMMMDWLRLSAVTELSSQELIDELKFRGYKGKLTKQIEIEL